MENIDLDSMANMSDEDFLKASSEYTEPEEQVESEVEEQEQEVPDEETQEEVETEESEESDEVDNDESEEDTEELDSEEETESEEEKGEEEDNNTTEAQAELDKLLSPFAANGTEIKVDSVDEAIDLMRMGANYHKKMHILKPHLKFIKTLEKNELLDEDKINFLIDLSKGDKSAISKLMTDGKIDPLDLETEGVEYSPVKHTISDNEINLDEVLNSIKDTPTFKDTMDIVTTQWDSSSKEILVNNPQRIAVLNAHKASGFFDRVNAEVTKARMLGKVDNNLSDIQAYEQIGSQLMQQDQAKGNQEQPKAKVNVEVEAKKAQTTAKKKKLSSPKSKTVTGKTLDLDALAKLSDEDFEKIKDKYI